MDALDGATASPIIILLYGPSGVGKSSAIVLASTQMSAVRFESLDQLAQDFGRRRRLIGPDQGILDLSNTLANADRLLEVGKEAVAELVGKGSRQVVVLDIGAGFLDAMDMPNWLRSNTPVVMMAPPKVVHDRIVAARNDQRSFAQYRAQEFSEDRLRLYHLAHFTMNADCSTVSLLGDRLVNLLRGLATTF